MKGIFIKYIYMNVLLALSIGFLNDVYTHSLRLIPSFASLSIESETILCLKTSNDFEHTLNSQRYFHTYPSAERWSCAIIHDQLSLHAKTLSMSNFPNSKQTSYKFPIVSSNPGAKLLFTYRNSY